MPPSKDEQLLARLTAGENVAWGEVYALYQPRVYRFALKLVRDADHAEDIVQDAFIKAHRAIHTLEAGASLFSWLLAITRNEVYNQLRKTRNNGQADAENVWDIETPLDGMIGRETVEIVQAMIGELRPEYREVVLLREYEGLSYAEIAQVTGATEGAVKAKLFKARKALVRKLKPFFGEQT